MSKNSKIWVTVLLVGMLISLLALGSVSAQTNGSLRFYGNGSGDIDRVKISIDNPAKAADIGGNFTIEFFMRAVSGENGSGSCTTGDAGWTNGNIIIDRDIFGPGDNGDFGISVFGGGGVIAFGVSRGNSGATVCGTTNVIDGNWHHIAATRNQSNGLLSLYVDGVLNGTVTGPTGDVSYRDGRSTSWPNDPFIVFGAEKHDFAPQYPSYSGWLDEVRISTNIRYTSTFSVPTTAFTTDANTVGLYHFDEGTGDTINDSSGTGSHGVRRYGGNPAGPVWSTDTPLTGGGPVNTPTFTPTFTPTPGPLCIENNVNTLYMFPQELLSPLLTQGVCNAQEAA
ncbi:MAG: LamG domain-containing protein [Anaerolineae bacterium]|nr:LamG domain-containing protein [Anaerolineae bacterium]